MNVNAKKFMFFKTYRFGTILSFRNPGHKIDLNPIYVPAPDMKPQAVYRDLRPDYDFI
jgi:hypothetical protein